MTKYFTYHHRHRHRHHWSLFFIFVFQTPSQHIHLSWYTIILPPLIQDWIWIQTNFFFPHKVYWFKACFTGLLLSIPITSWPSLPSRGNMILFLDQGQQTLYLHFFTRRYKPISWGKPFDTHTYAHFGGFTNHTTDTGTLGSLDYSPNYLPSEFRYLIWTNHLPHHALHHKIAGLDKYRVRQRRCVINH